MLPVCGRRPFRKVTAMGWLSDFAGDVVDVVSDAADVIGDVGEAIGDAVVDAGSAAGGAAGSFAGDAFDVVANFTDDTVFDSVDYLTGGVVDIDYDDGTFGADIGIDGIAQVGIEISEDGVEATLEATVVNADLGITDEGFAVSASGGIDWGPLPYAEGHLSVSADGDVIINGHVQGTIPLPGGILSGQATAGFQSTDEGWGVNVAADGTYTMPSGTTIGGGIVAGYAETADGASHTTLGAQGSISVEGVGSASGGVTYDRLESDGVVVEQFHAEAQAQGFGVTAGAEADYVGIETPQGSASQWTTDVDLELPDELEQLGSSLLGITGDPLAPTTPTSAASSAVTAAPGTPGAGGPADDPFADDVLAGAPGAEPAGTGAPLASDLAGDDVLGGSAPADPMETATIGATDPGPAGLDLDAPAPMVDDAIVEPVVAAPEPVAYEPAGDFSQAISSAEQVETSLDADVDDMFDGLG